MRKVAIVALAFLLTEVLAAQETPLWTVEGPVLTPGPEGSFDEIAVKDPSVVFFNKRWHVFYTARSKDGYTTGYIAAPTLQGLSSAPRHPLPQLKGTSDSYACAPQVFYFKPRGLWYLVLQTRDSNYQPAFTTTKDLENPAAWQPLQPLLIKDEEAKWIDFWVICDKTTAYLFYTRDHREVVVRSTAIENFPAGWSPGQTVFSGIHEAAHVYKLQGREEYRMLYELEDKGLRRFGMARAKHLAGPWEELTDRFACGEQLVFPKGLTAWTDRVSHGEFLRTGFDQHLEIDPENAPLLFQGLSKEESEGPYPMLPWKLGLLERPRAPGVSP
jgi:hypothetical protein